MTSTTTSTSDNRKQFERDLGRAKFLADKIIKFLSKKGTPITVAFIACVSAAVWVAKNNGIHREMFDNMINEVYERVRAE